MAGRGRPVARTNDPPPSMAPGGMQNSYGNNNQGFGGGNAQNFGGDGNNFGQNSGFGQQQQQGGGFGQSQGQPGGFGQQQGGFGQSGGGGGGFGGSGGGGFDNAAGGFGASSGGFGGSSGGFGASSGGGGGGFGGQDNFASSRGGSGGRSNTGSNNCRNCNEPGHFARECPKGRGGFSGGGRGGRECYKCQETGHIARDCPNGGQATGGYGGGSGAGFGGGNGGNDGFGGGGNSGGFGGGGNDSGYGSRSSGFNNSDGFGGGAGGGFRSGGGGGDFVAGSHLENALPPTGQGRVGGGGGDRACFNCKEMGHISRDCDKPKSYDGAGGDGRSNKCFKCNGTGHMARDCQENVEFEASAKKPPSKHVPEEPSVDALWNQHISAGINFDRYFHIPVEVTGNDTSKERIMSFDQAGFPPQVLENVQKAQYTTPTPIQQNAIPYILAGRDIMACAQTGSGKTAAFLLPMLSSMVNSGSMADTKPGNLQEPLVVIMAPTRELAIQIKDEARKFAAGTPARIVAVYGGTAVYHQKAQLREGCNVVVATPGRLADFIKQGIIGLSKCKFLVLDEADRMLDMGFEGVVRQIVDQSDMTPKTDRQTLMFSATFPTAIQDLALEFLNDHIFITIGAVGAANMDITQEIILVKDKGEKKELALKYVVDLMNEAKNEDGTYHKKTMIFVQRKRTADYLAAELCGDEADLQEGTAVRATSLHGDREQKEREQVFSMFKSGKFPVLVATDVAARGLDIQEVDHVINYDMPTDITDYVHRIGRTARVGNVGRSTSFFDLDTDTPIAKELLKVLVDAQQQLPEWLEQLARDGFYAPPLGEDTPSDDW